MDSGGMFSVENETDLCRANAPLNILNDEDNNSNMEEAMVVNSSMGEVNSSMGEVNSDTAEVSNSNTGNNSMVNNNSNSPRNKATRVEIPLLVS